MIATQAEIVAVLGYDPMIDPDIFWPRVGVATEVLLEYALVLAEETGLSPEQVAALLETGATLAEAGLKRLADGSKAYPIGT